MPENARLRRRSSGSQSVAGRRLLARLRSRRAPKAPGAVWTRQEHARLRRRSSGSQSVAGRRRPAPPGPWLRLCAVLATAGTAVVVTTGEWGRSHEAAVLGTLALTIGVALAVWFGHRDRTALVRSALAALVVFAAQIGLGGLVALTDAGWLDGLHVALGAISLAASVVTAALTLRLTAPAPLRPLPWRDYLTLTKPRVMTLLLLTGLGGLFVGEQGVPSLGLVAATLGGLALACGGAAALNHVLDADIDVHMKRTDRRPVATGRVAPERALEFGLALLALSFVVLTSFVNVVAALLAIFGGLFYVVVYTRWLKRTTPQNIVIGGAAGAIPPVVGWAAATGDLRLPALFLFLIVFYWTPPHFWALALLIRREYERANVPMLPVVRGEHATAVSIVRYTILLIGITLLPFFFADMSWVYLGAALALGAAFLVRALGLLRDTSVARAKGVFTFSMSYLALLFVAMAIDPIILG